MDHKYETVPFRREHLPYILATGTTELSEQSFYQDERLLSDVENSTNSWTALVDGIPVAAGGTLELWNERHLAWALFSNSAKYFVLSVSRTAREVVSRPKGRVECTVDSEFAAGKSWARLLGFHVETETLKHYGPDGADHVGFVRMN